jgi:DNA-binding CsgD family transcriptional regulator
MSTTEIKSELLGEIAPALEALLASETTSGFCRSLVHSAFTGDATQGCHIYALNNNAQLNVVAGYGLNAVDTDDEITAWDNNAISQSIRDKHYIFELGGKDRKSLIAIPLLRNNLPVGALVIVLAETATKMPFGEAWIAIIGTLGTFSLGMVGGHGARGVVNESTTNGEDLTSRQIQILDMMAEGLVNTEIARQLMLSESTIRQETVRIYRSLGVPNRSEASKKGRTLGLISRRPLIGLPA